MPHLPSHPWSRLISSVSGSELQSLFFVVFGLGFTFAPCFGTDFLGSLKDFRFGLSSRTLDKSLSSSCATVARATCDSFLSVLTGLSSAMLASVGDSATSDSSSSEADLIDVLRLFFGFEVSVKDRFLAG